MRLQDKLKPLHLYLYFLISYDYGQKTTLRTIICALLKKHLYPLVTSDIFKIRKFLRHLAWSWELFPWFAGAWNSIEEHHKATLFFTNIFSEIGLPSGTSATCQVFTYPDKTFLPDPMLSSSQFLLK